MGARRPPHGLSMLMFSGLSHKGVLRKPSTGLNRAIQATAQRPFSVLPAIAAVRGGAGILTCFPLPTPFGLGLGAD